jgi:hypothetical protein
MRFFVIAMIVLYLLLAFMGCLDREQTIRRAGIKEVYEVDPENASGGGFSFGRFRDRLFDATRRDELKPAARDRLRHGADAGTDSHNVLANNTAR